jgi:hypothetical protein
MSLVNACSARRHEWDPKFAFALSTVCVWVNGALTVSKDFS